MGAAKDDFSSIERFQDAIFREKEEGLSCFFCVRSPTPTTLLAGWEGGGGKTGWKAAPVNKEAKIAWEMALSCGSRRMSTACWGGLLPFWAEVEVEDEASPGYKGFWQMVQRLEWGSLWKVQCGHET